jgi:hypothetical protein
VVDFLTWFFALYPVWILGCGFLLWRSKEYRTNGDALVHTAVTLPFAVGMAILFYIWPLLLFGWGPGPIPPSSSSLRWGSRSAGSCASGRAGNVSRPGAAVHRQGLRLADLARAPNPLIDSGNRA